MSQIAIDFTARDKVLEAHRRKELVRWLEYRMYFYSIWLSDSPSEWQPVSANLCRETMARFSLEFDARAYGGVFPVSRWRQVGETHSPCNARKIRTFVPKRETPGYFREPVPQPEWLVEK
jgi:hypothetical protein